MEGNISD